jgi:hypothetical protein
VDWGVTGLIEVYYYIPAIHAENASDCGLKLSDWYDREVVIDGEIKKCITALLNPRDNYEKYSSSEYKCLKFQLLPKYCHIADGMLYRVGFSFNGIMDLYGKSIIPIESYIFGSYRLPECLVACTVIGEDIEILDKRFDTPILYRNSEDLYLNNLIEGYKDVHENFYDTMLYFFYSSMADSGYMKRTEDIQSGIAVFEDIRNSMVYTVKMPDIGLY